MTFPTTVAVAVDVTKENLESLKAIRKMEFLKDADIHFIHIIREIP
jgi:hypothetical protein